MCWQMHRRVLSCSENGNSNGSPRWSGQTCSIFSTDPMQNDDRFDKDSKFVAVCFHKFCVIYFVCIVFDTKAKKQEGTGGGCASIFHIIIFNTKTILFANTDGDQ